MYEQKKIIHEMDWDILIILDACRPDYFEKNFKNFFAGKYQRVKSSGSNTPAWIRNTFPDYYENIIYISGNPYISSKIKTKQIIGYCAGEHFYMVDDVFIWGWKKDNESDIETVFPDEIIRATIKWLQIFPNKKFILHFMQPHSPYVGKTKLKIGVFKAARNQIISLPCRRYVGMVNHPKLRTAYEDNLKFVLEKIKNNLLPFIKDKRIHITADHSELLGENNIFGHHIDHNFLKEVPYLIIDDCKS